MIEESKKENNTLNDSSSIKQIIEARRSAELHSRYRKAFNSSD